MSLLTLEAKLERTDKSTPWGFRMQGGKDYSSPLTIQRVTPGSLAAKCGLQAGDIILKIGNAGTESLRHKEAQDIIISCPNRLDLLLQRGSSGIQPAYDKFPVSPVGAPAPSNPGTFSTSVNFNAAPKPFGAPSGPPNYVGPSSVPSYGSPAPPPAAPSYGVGNLSQQTQNMSLGGSGGGITPGQAAGGAKPATWTPKPAPAPVAPAAPVSKPWAPPAPAPTGPPMGMGRPAGGPKGPVQRGKKGDAVIRQQGATGADIPRVATCSQCGNTIRGPFVVALSKTWCPDHFICANPRCGVKLIDIGFVEEGGFLYCERDYEQHFAPRCEKCKGAIVGECVNALQKSYHPHCFLCFQCKQPIGGNQFHIEDGNCYCEKDWNAMFQTMCAGCNFPIEPGDKWVEAMNKNFHSECFNCATCQVSLEGAPFYVKAGKPFCKKHVR